MDSEIAVISRMVQLGAVDELISAGIEPRHFHDIACREVYETCLKHQRTWRSPPSAEAVRKRHPDFKLEVVRDELAYLIQEFKLECEFRAGLQKWRDIGEMLDRVDAGKIDERSRIAELFMAHAQEMMTLIPVARASRFSDMARRIIEIREQQEADDLPGVRLGISVLEPYIRMVRDSEFVVHAAFSSVGKTTGMVRSGIQAYQDGDLTGFFSLEMEEGEIWEMFDAHAAGLSRTAIQHRELGKADYERYEEAAARVAGASNDIVVFDDIPGGATVSSLAAMVERYGFKTICVDYISLMKPTVTNAPKWEGVAEISAALKQLARAYKIKVYAAAQNTRDAAVEGPTLDNIAHSLTIFQDCNIMVGYHQDEEMAKKNQVQVRLVKARGNARTTSSTHPYEYWDRDRLIFEPWTREHEWKIKLESAA